MFNSLANKINAIEADINELKKINNTNDEIVGLNERIDTLEKNNELLLSKLESIEKSNKHIDDLTQELINNKKNVLQQFNIDIFNDLGHEEQVKYLREVNLTESVTHNGIKYLNPLHLICDKSSSESIKLVFDIYEELKLNVDDVDVNSKHQCAINYICRKSTVEMIKYVFNFYLKNNIKINYFSIENPINSVLCCHHINKFDVEIELEIMEYIFDIYVSYGKLSDYNYIFRDVLFYRYRIDIIKRILNKYQELPNGIAELNSILNFGNLIDKFINYTNFKYNRQITKIYSDKNLLLQCIDPNSLSVNFSLCDITAELFIEIMNMLE